MNVKDYDASKVKNHTKTMYVLYMYVDQNLVLKSNT